MAVSDYDRYLEDLARRRAPAVAEAKRLLAEDRYDEAEQTIVRTDSSIYGEVEVASLYRHRLEELVAAGVTPQTRPRLEAIFHRALSWADRAFPEPHTAMEASQYDEARAENRAALVRILGYDPTEE